VKPMTIAASQKTSFKTSSALPWPIPQSFDVVVARQGVGREEWLYYIRVRRVHSAAHEAGDLVFELDAWRSQSQSHLTALLESSVVVPDKSNRLPQGLAQAFDVMRTAVCKRAEDDLVRTGLRSRLEEVNW
jgi:hypothetical protein